MLARLRALRRLIVFKLLPTVYCAYSAGSDVGGYDGWYERGGRAVAFQYDGSLQFRW